MGAIKSATATYLRIYGKYKFRLVTDIVWIMVNVLTFAFMGGVIEPKAGTINYSFTEFFMVGILFWTFFEAPYINTVMIVPEEAGNGTLGILYTNGVTPFRVMVSQMLSSTLINVLLALFVVFPIIVFVGAINIYSLSYPLLLLLVPVLVVCWFFMMAVGIIFGSLALLVKKLGGTAGVVVQGLKIASGFFFPIVGFPTIIQPIVEKIPITIGLSMTRDILILKTVSNVLDNMFWLCSGTIFIFLLSYAIYMSAERKARLLGNIESY